MVLEVFEEWGRRLTAGALLYALLSMMLTYGLAAAGIEPPQLVPRDIYNLYGNLTSAWGSVSGVVSGDPGAVLLFMFQAVVNIGLLALGILGTVATAYIWMAVLATQYLPGPLRVLAPMLWALGFMANMAVLAYLFKRVLDAVRSVPLPLAR